MRFVSLSLMTILLSLIILSGCSMNRCKTIVDPNPPPPPPQEATAAADANSYRTGPWATPSHNPSMTQLPNQVSSSSTKPNIDKGQMSPVDTKNPAQLPPPSATLPSDAEVPVDKNAPSMNIYKYDGSRQCGQGKPLNLDEMAKELKGITILSQENKNDGMMRIQMCGAPTGNANIYVIYQKDLKKAFRKGFREWKPEAN